MFSSEKVLQMSYANYQFVLFLLLLTEVLMSVLRGKEALIDKFKNSCIMDERQEWQPRIFCSDPGPQQGMPEPFPSPTHMRRKERSLHNRGNLFSPGLNTPRSPVDGNDDGVIRRTRLRADSWARNLLPGSAAKRQHL